MIVFAAIVFARLNSNRLPGKVLFSLGGQTILGHCIKKLQSISNLRIVVATSDRIDDNPICDWCNANNVRFFRGDLENVAQRTLECLQSFPCDAFFRVNADSPFLQTDLFVKAIERYGVGGSVDIVSNVVERSYPYGISVELINSHTFQDVVNDFQGEEKEHITSFFYKNRDRFGVEVIKLGADFSSRRLVLDTTEDWRFIKELYSRDNNIFNYRLLELLNLTNLQ